MTEETVGETERQEVSSLDYYPPATGWCLGSLCWVDAHLGYLIW